MFSVGCSYTVPSHACTPAHAAFGNIRKYSGIPTETGSQPSLFSIFFFTVRFEAIGRVTQGGQMRGFCFAPPCFSAMTSSLPCVTFPQFSKPADGWKESLHKQHSWLLCQLWTNATSFHRASCFPSLQPLWKACIWAADTTALFHLPGGGTWYTIKPYRARSHWPVVFRVDGTRICSVHFHFTLITSISQSALDKHFDGIKTEHSVCLSNHSASCFTIQ